MRLGDEESGETFVVLEVSRMKRSVLGFGRLVKAGMTVHLSPKRLLDYSRRGSIEGGATRHGKVRRDAGRDLIVAPLGDDEPAENDQGVAVIEEPTVVVVEAAADEAGSQAAAAAMPRPQQPPPGEIARY